MDEALLVRPKGAMSLPRDLWRFLDMEKRVAHASAKFAEIITTLRIRTEEE